MTLDLGDEEQNVALCHLLSSAVCHAYYLMSPHVVPSIFCKIGLVNHLNGFT